MLWQELTYCERCQGLMNSFCLVVLEAFHQDSFRSGWELGIMTGQWAKLCLYEVIDLQVCRWWRPNGVAAVIGEE